VVVSRAVSILSVLCALSACASKPAEPAKSQYTYVYMTGSNIPVKVLKGSTTSTISAKPTQSVSAQEIQLTGLDNTAQALRQMTPPLNQ